MASVPTAFGVRVSKTRDAACLSLSLCWSGGHGGRGASLTGRPLQSCWSVSSGGVQRVSDANGDALLLPEALALHPLGQASPVLLLFASQILLLFFFLSIEVQLVSQYAVNLCCEHSDSGGHTFFFILFPFTICHGILNVVPESYSQQALFLSPCL